MIKTDLFDPSDREYKKGSYPIFWRFEIKVNK